MTPIDLREALMWGGIAALVVLMTFTGMCINRFFTHRAHRRALEDLRRRVATAMRPDADPASRLPDSKVESM